MLCATMYFMFHSFWQQSAAFWMSDGIKSTSFHLVLLHITESDSDAYYAI